MDSQQRFLRRKYLLDNADRLLRESAYHRSHEEVEALPGIEVWCWDEAEGEGHGIF